MKKAAIPLLFIVLFIFTALIFGSCSGAIDPNNFIRGMLDRDQEEEEEEAKPEPGPSPGGVKYDKIIKNDTDLKAAIDSQETNTGKQSWYIEKGEYNVQISIYRDITIVGASKDVIIQGPINYNITTLKGLKTDDVHIQPYYEAPIWGSLLIDHIKPAWITGIITIENCKAEIKNLTVKGIPSRGSKFADSIYNCVVEGKPRRGFFGGIGIVGAEVNIDNVIITGIHDEAAYVSNRYACGIVAASGTGETKNLTVTNCIIKEFQRNGVVVMPGVKKLTFKNNQVIGQTKIPLGSTLVPDYGTHIVPAQASRKWGCAQNGMSIECLQAEITGNIFKDLVWEEDINTVSMGIMIYLGPTDDHSKYDSSFLTTTSSSSVNVFEIANLFNPADPLHNIEDSPARLDVYYFWTDKDYFF